MNIATPLALEPTSPHQRAILPIHGLIETHQNALRHAAWLLGGSDGANLVDKISDALSRELVPSLRTIGLLIRLKDILFLEHVDDPNRPESGYFAAIDPADPVVEEICMLADSLAMAFRAPPKASAHGGCATDANGALRSHYSAGAQAMGNL